jgi:hypothetical protein
MKEFSSVFQCLHEQREGLQPVQKKEEPHEGDRRATGGAAEGAEGGTTSTLPEPKPHETV